MKTLYMMKGLPGSGKTTRAKEMLEKQPGAFKRVNKDDLRALLDGGKWSQDNEKFILVTRDSIVKSALALGKHVIVDDTNLVPKHEVRLRQLAKEGGAAFEVIDCTHISPEECITRDLKRPNSVGCEVIKRMYADFIAPKVDAAPHDPSLPWCVICDIDGTVAKMNGRSPYDYSKVDTDTPHEPVIAAVKALYGQYTVLFVSGRKAECREATENWLGEHLGYRGPLFMRETDDNRDDRIVKEEIYRREILGKYNVRFVLDDRDRVVKKWRELGLTCFQVAEGNF